MLNFTIVHISEKCYVRIDQKGGESMVKKQELHAQVLMLNLSHD